MGTRAVKFIIWYYVYKICVKFKSKGWMADREMVLLHSPCLSRCLIQVSCLLQGALGCHFLCNYIFSKISIANVRYIQNDRFIHILTHFLFCTIEYLCHLPKIYLVYLSVEQNTLPCTENDQVRYAIGKDIVWSFPYFTFTPNALCIDDLFWYEEIVSVFLLWWSYICKTNIVSTLWLLTKRLQNQEGKSDQCLEFGWEVFRRR